MSVTEDDVRHVAALARLGLPPERVPALVRELNGILDHMEVLQQVDIAAASLAPDASNASRMRDDVHNPIPLHSTREQFAPLMRDGFFLVPRLATHGTVGGAGASASLTSAADVDSDGAMHDDDEAHA